MNRIPTKLKYDRNLFLVQMLSCAMPSKKRKPGSDSSKSEYRKSPFVSKKKLPLWKFTLFAILPVMLLLLSAEGVVRIAGLASPLLKTEPLPEEKARLFRHDPELFWSLKPNLDIVFEGVQINTNSDGLRGKELQPKQAGEYRILSLGESTTFGIGVHNHETYTALLPEMLKQKYPSLNFNSINAGVSAWSSFQSLVFLKNRGLKLKPDLLLFYHEMNDYLPSSLRDASNTEIEILFLSVSPPKKNELPTRRTLSRLQSRKQSAPNIFR